MKEKTLPRPPRSKTLLAWTLLFFLFSFVGWCMEKGWFYLAYRVNEDRGFLTLPFCTVYGSGLLLVRVLLGLPKSGETQYPVNLLEFLIYALLAAVIATTAELATGLFFERVFGAQLWSYEGYPHTLTEYVCLPMSCAWGVLAAAVMPSVWAPLEKRLARQSYSVLIPPAALLVTASLIDFIVTAIGCFA